MWLLTLCKFWEKSLHEKFVKYGGKFRQISVCPKTVVFVECPVFGGRLTKIRVACSGFNVSALQTETLSTQTMEITRAGLQISEILWRKVWWLHCARLNGQKNLSPHSGDIMEKFFVTKLDPNIEPTPYKTHFNTICSTSIFKVGLWNFRRFFTVRKRMFES